MSAASYAGIPLALLATTAYNVGLILEKRALGRMPTIDMRRVPRVIASLLTSRAWLAGFTMVVSGVRALAVGSVRGLATWLMVGQVGWVAAALAVHDQRAVAAAKRPATASQL